MSYLLETLGRGLLADLHAAFEAQLAGPADDELETLRARFAASPTSVDLALRVGALSLREVQLREAEAAFEAAHRLEPRGARPLLGLACVADALGQLERARSYLEQARVHDSHDPAIAFGIAFCHERAGELAQAEAGYRAAIELCPQLRNAYERLAAIALHKRAPAEALQHYEQLAALEPQDLDVLLTLGNLYLLAERPADAVDQYQNALLIEPDPIEEPLAGVAEPDADGALRDAIARLEKLTRKYPAAAPFHVQLGDLYVQAGDDVRALTEYQTALATQPNFLEATVKLGTQHMRQGRYVDAALAFNRAVELNDRLIGAFAGLGVAQHDCGRKLESLSTIDLAASLEPSTTLLFSEAMRLHLQAQQPDAVQAGDDDEGPAYQAVLQDALRRHEQALANSPNHADLHYRYGLLLRQVGRHQDATQAFRNAVAINPNYTKALIKLGICLKDNGESRAAVEAFQRALRLDDRYVDVHYQLGLLFAQRHQFDLAVEEFEQALSSESNASFRANLALALQNIGMVDRASATWRAICEMTPATDEMLARRESVLRALREN